MKILFLTSAHNSNDDRIYFLQAKTLAVIHEVKVFSTFGGEQIVDVNLISEYDSTFFSSRKEKITALYNQCVTFNPDVIICSEPIPIIAAHRFVKQKNLVACCTMSPSFIPQKRIL